MFKTQILDNIQNNVDVHFPTRKKYILFWRAGNQIPAGGFHRKDSKLKDYLFLNMYT